MSGSNTRSRSLSFDDLGMRKSPASENYGNVHILVEDYVRDKNGAATAVQGVNLKTGEEMTVALADRDRFAKLYGRKGQDQSMRLANADKLIANRVPLADYGAARGAKKIDVGGVLSIEDVRKDYSTGELVGRWPKGIVVDPQVEAVSLGSFEIKQRQRKNVQPGELEYSAFFVQSRPKEAVSAENASREVLDDMLSGKLAGTDAPMRTMVSVSFPLQGEVKTFVLRSPVQFKEDINEVFPGVEAAVSTGHNKYTAVAAVAVAAAADVPFDTVKTSGDVDPALRQRLRDLYDGIQQGEIKASYMPGATFAPTKNVTLALYGLKTNKAGGVEEAATRERNLLDRGYFEGVVSLLHVTMNGKTVEPVVKTIQPDTYLAAKGAESFVRVDPQALGERSFDVAYGPGATGRAMEDHSKAMEEAEEASRAASRGSDVGDANEPDPGDAPDRDADVDSADENEFDTPGYSF